MREMLYVGFYLWYVAEWVVRLCKKGNAYYNIGFEREAYRHMYEKDYLERCADGGAVEWKEFARMSLAARMRYVRKNNLC